jgi:hypothetical protein
VFDPLLLLWVALAVALIFLVVNPLFRLVQFQLEREVRESDKLLGPLQQGRVLSAVYRVSPPSSSKPQGLALRLMIDPKRMADPMEIAARATA